MKVGRHLGFGRPAQVQVTGGLALVALFWWSNWHPGRLPLRSVGFFCLWLGYILTVDGLVRHRTGTSPLARSRRRWAALFAVSVPAWWLFEYLNTFLGNWEYMGLESYSPLQNYVYSSLSFSTVIPAVFTTTELVGSYGIPRWLTRWPTLPMTPRALAGWIAAGLLLFGGITLAPNALYPAAWLAVFFVLDPVNHLLGWPSIAARVERGDWQLVAALASATLVCGFFWEMWNYHSDPKWIYHIPLFGRGEALELPRGFEMPLLGYLGYIPFGLDLYALYHFLAGLSGGGSALELRFDERS